jgi:DNA-binding NtrC family response regulator
MPVDNSSRPVRILVVDDEPIVGKRLKQAFGKMGFTVEAETNGAAALERLAEGAFDIVVTDLKMQGMDGMEVLTRVRELNPETRVIIITGYAEAGTADQAFRDGVFDFIAKPFRLAELKKVILRAIEEGRGGKGPPESPQ